MPSRVPPLTQHRHRGTRNRRDPLAGAAVVEYALAVGLVAVALVGGINLLEGASRDGLEDRAASAGAPDLEPGAPTSSTTAVPTTAPPADPGTTSPPAVSPTAELSSSSTKDGSDWVATVVVKVIDPGTGLPVARANVAAQWSDGYTATTTCITSDDGTCPMSSAEIDRTGGTAVASVKLTITGITGDGVTYTEMPPSETVWAPGTTPAVR